MEDILHLETKMNEDIPENTIEYGFVYNLTCIPQEYYDEQADWIERIQKIGQNK